MSDDPRERELTARLRALRDRDESAGPAFSRVWNAARAAAEARAARRRGYRRAGAAAALAGAGLWVLMLAHTPSEPEPAELLRLAQELEAWEAPLDFLLVTPGDELLETIPAFGRALPEGALEMDPATEERTQS